MGIDVKLERSLVVMAVLLQLIGCLFFAGQIFLAVFGISLRPMPWQLYEIHEMISALSLGVGVVIGLALLRRVITERRRAVLALKNATSAFGDLLNERFQQWGLSGAERDVALFLIKGMSTAEIARMRGSSEGTIKAQSAAIYRKANVTGKTQPVSTFVEDMFED